MVEIEITKLFTFQKGISSGSEPDQTIFARRNYKTLFNGWNWNYQTTFSNLHMMIGMISYC